MSDKALLKYCQHCREYFNRGVSVDAIIQKEKSILLVKRKNDPCKNYWALPGGFVDWDETLETAIRREVKEETNLDIVKLHLLGVYSKPQRHPKQVINATFIVSIKGVEKAGDDVSECKYFPLDSLPKVLAFDHLRIIADFKNRKYQLKSD